MSNKKIIYFDQVFDEFKQVLFANKPEDYQLYFWKEMDDEEKAKNIGEADYLLVATEHLGEEVISKAKRTQFIQKTGMGVDNINLEAATHYRLPVANTPGANAISVSELTILLILSLYRKLTILNESTKKGEWLMWALRPSSFEMHGKTHGFIGFGNIGQEAAQRSKAFGTNIIYNDKFRASEDIENQLDATYLSLEEVLQTSDIVSLHIPLVPETKRIIGLNELQMMKPGAVLVNVSRGGIVDEQALYEALKNQMIAGAGIDVWEQEPINSNNPLLSLDNVIASPHIGAGTRDTLNRVLTMAFDNMKRVDTGHEPNYVVNQVAKARTV